LEDGEINLVGGILTDEETHSLSGYPWLAKIPLLKYLFGQENKDRRETEIVFAITPHIVRAEEITDENLRLIDIGTSSSVALRRGESKKKAGNGAVAAEQACGSRFSATTESDSGSSSRPPLPNPYPPGSWCRAL